MQTINITKFKTTCSSMLERVKKTGKPLLITKRGKPVALVSAPAAPAERAKSFFGCMKGTVTIKGDIVKPLPVKDWEVLKK